MTGRAHRLVAFLGKAEPRRPPSGWALALDAAIAVAAAVGAVMEVADRTLQNLFVGPGGAIMTQPVAVHAARRSARGRRADRRCRWRPGGCTRSWPGS